MSMSGLHVEHHGPPIGLPYVLVHGAPDRSGLFRELLPCLRDRRVVVYDRRGYGRSLDAPPAHEMIDHSEDLLSIVEDCKTPPVVVAHSFGSIPTVLAATLRRAAFSAVGLWEPPLPWLDWWPEENKTYAARLAVSTDPGNDIEETYRRLLGDKTWTGLSPSARARRRAEGRALQIDMAAMLRAPFDLKDVNVPVLVGCGGATSVAHDQGARWLAERLPDAGLRVIEGAGHFAPRTHPREFASFMREVALLGPETLQ